MIKTKEKTKYCLKCNSVKPESAFSKNSTKKDGLQTYCKSCAHPKKEKKQKYIKNETPLKKCSKCHIEKPLEEFYTNQRYCKNCSKKLSKQRYNKINHEITSLNKTPLKKCSKCNKEKPLSEFSKDNNSKDNLQGYCKACAKEKYIFHYENNKVKLKERQLSHKYNITMKDYHTMLYKQEGKCFICGKSMEESNVSFAVDHNHSTGVVRGLLCTKCNTHLGWLETVTLEKIMEYLNIKFKVEKPISKVIHKIMGNN